MTHFNVFAKGSMGLEFDGRYTHMEAALEYARSLDISEWPEGWPDAPLWPLDVQVFADEEEWNPKRFEVWPEVKTIPPEHFNSSALKRMKRRGFIGDAVAVTFYAREKRGE